MAHLFFVHLQIVSKGKILVTKTVAMSSNQETFSEMMTAEMSPTARLVVYYIGTASDEMIADSLSFYVNTSAASNVS